MPTISAGALKRMRGLPANVVAGVPRIEKDPHGGDVVIVPVRPYAKDMDRCTRCGKHVRPYDRLGVRRWRHLDIGCARLMLEYAPPHVTCADHGVTVAMMPWVRRKSAYTRDFEQQTALLNVHAPRSAVSRLMRMDWKSVGPVCRRVAETCERSRSGPVRRAAFHRRGRDQLQEGPQVHDRGRRPRPGARHLDASGSRTEGVRRACQIVCVWDLFEASAVFVG